MRAWWLGLSPSERRTVTLGGAALALVLFYFLAWRPPQVAIERLSERTANARDDLAWLEEAAAQAKRLKAAASEGNTGGRALYALADETARAAGLGEAIQRVEPSGKARVRVRLRGAVFEDLVRWLAELKRDQGVTAATVSLRRADPGRVDAQLELREADK